jgi:ATP-dependent helicase HrpA
MDRPDHESFEQALQTLRTLGALNRDELLTEIGYKMAHLPLDPRISRMLLTAEEADCVAEVAVIASFLSLKDPFVRPFGDEAGSDKSRSYFQHLGMTSPMPQAKPFFNGNRTVYRRHSGYGAQSFNSDLLTFLALWKKVFSYKEYADREAYCRSHYVDFEQMEKAREIYLQLIETLVQFYGGEFEYQLENLKGMLDPEFLKNVGPGADNVDILKSVASGLVQNLCQRNKFGNYSSEKVDHVFIHPGSLFFNRHPKWIIATEILETTKRFARNVTEVDPGWFQNTVSRYSRGGHSKNRPGGHRKTKKRHSQGRGRGGRR